MAPPGHDRGIYRHSDVRHAHIELTTRCNAACPMCARNVRGRVAPGLVACELSVERIREILTPEWLERLEAIDLCGAYGDPIVAKDLIEIVRYARMHHPDLAVSVFTNGGARTEAWWRELADALGREGEVVFAIDGLADTNDVYRRGVCFERVLANARAFIEQGGRAQWDYLVFRHNEHQVEDARTIARELGFAQFNLKMTSRFLKGTHDYVPELDGGLDLDRFPIHDVDGQQVGLLEPASRPNLVNEQLLWAKRSPDPRGELSALLDRTTIHCKVARSGSVFISATAHAYPCCWTYVQATTPVLYEFPVGIDMQVHQLLHSCGGFDAIALDHHELSAIIEGPFFRALAQSWSKDSVTAGRTKVCARVCGDGFRAFDHQFSDERMIPGAIRKDKARCSI